MTDAQIMDAILRRIGDQASDDRSRVYSEPASNGGHTLTRNGKIVGTLFVAGGTVTVNIDDGTEFSLPDRAGSPLTETDIDAAAATIIQTASRLSW